MHKRAREALEENTTTATDADHTAEPRRKKRKLRDHSNEAKEETNKENEVCNTNNLDTETEPQPEHKSKSKAASKPKRGRKKKSKSSKPTKGKSNDEFECKDEETAGNQMEYMDKLKSKHRELLTQGYRCVVGCDEAGRGPLAGPVVISAAYVPIDVYIEGITDSKKINDENEREKLYELITQNKRIKYAVTVFDHEVIDEYNILEASMMGMRECVVKLHDAMKAERAQQPLPKEDEEEEEEERKDVVADGVDYVLCDGNRDP
eukprot:CAMPEP_0197026508 /NCGR_PEP_ID=MMETSP1384-20130603/6577_1 /TAXON_ID=29189 /ORGANISM="Ammonia sp." /LENGTH=262 /DNA_ID=CAMNT_0042455185 /DNA_START=84 /DNA_END=868 /DNA_ORIENTATION=+